MGIFNLFSKLNYDMNIWCHPILNRFEFSKYIRTPLIYIYIYIYIYKLDLMF